MLSTSVRPTSYGIIGPLPNLTDRRTCQPLLDTAKQQHLEALRALAVASENLRSFMHEHGSLETAGPVSPADDRLLEDTVVHLHQACLKHQQQASRANATINNLERMVLWDEPSVGGWISSSYHADRDATRFVIEELVATFLQLTAPVLPPPKTTYGQSHARMPQIAVTDIQKSMLIDAVACKTLFTCLCIEGTLPMQQMASRLLTRTCSTQPWWGGFLCSILHEYFGSGAEATASRIPTDSSSQNRIFALLCQMAANYYGSNRLDERVARWHVHRCAATLRDVLCFLSKQVLGDFLSPGHTAEPFHIEDGFFDGKGSSVDTTLLTWTLILLDFLISVICDASLQGSQRSCTFEPSSRRWDFLQPVCTSRHSPSSCVRCALLDPKNGSLRHSRSFADNTFFKVNFGVLKQDPLFLEMRQECVTVTTLLLKLMLRLDHLSDAYTFALSCKVVGRLAAVISQPVQRISESVSLSHLTDLLIKVMSTPQLSPAIEGPCGAEWAVHAVSCMMQDILEGPYASDFKALHEKKSAVPVTGSHRPPNMPKSQGLAEGDSDYPGDTLCASYVVPGTSAVSSSAQQQTLMTKLYLNAHGPLAGPPPPPPVPPPSKSLAGSVSVSVDYRHSGAVDEIATNRLKEWYFEAARTLSEADGTSLLTGLDTSNEPSENLPRGQNVHVPTFDDGRIPINQDVISRAFDAILGPVSHNVTRLQTSASVDLDAALSLLAELNSTQGHIYLSSEAVAVLLSRLSCGDLQAVISVGRTWPLLLNLLTSSVQSEVLDKRETRQRSFASALQLVTSDDLKKLLNRLISGHYSFMSTSVHCIGNQYGLGIAGALKQFLAACYDSLCDTVDKVRAWCDFVMGLIQQLLPRNGDVWDSVISRGSGPIDLQCVIVEATCVGVLKSQRMFRGKLWAKETEASVVKAVLILTRNHLLTSEPIVTQGSLTSLPGPRTMTTRLAMPSAHAICREIQAITFWTTVFSGEPSRRMLMLRLIELASLLTINGNPAVYNRPVGSACRQKKGPVAGKQGECTYTCLHEAPTSADPTSAVAAHDAVADIVIASTDVIDVLFQCLALCKFASGSQTACPNSAFMDAAGRRTYFCAATTEADGLYLLACALYRNCSFDNSNKLVRDAARQIAVSPTLTAICGSRRNSAVLHSYFLSLLVCHHSVAAFVDAGGIEATVRNFIGAHSRYSSVPTGGWPIAADLFFGNASSPADRPVCATWSGKFQDAVWDSQKSAGVQRLQNFAPFGDVTCSCSDAASANDLLRPHAQHRRARSASWTYNFAAGGNSNLSGRSKPKLSGLTDKCHVELVIRLPMAVLLHEVDIIPHHNTSGSGFPPSVPSAVGIEVSSSIRMPAVPVGTEVVTSGLHSMKIKLKKPMVATKVVIRLHRAVDSHSISLSQIVLLGQAALTYASPAAIPGQLEASSERASSIAEQSADLPCDTNTLTTWLDFLDKCVVVSRKISSGDSDCSGNVDPELYNAVIQALVGERFRSNSEALMPLENWSQKIVLACTDLLLSSNLPTRSLSASRDTSIWHNKLHCLLLAIGSYSTEQGLQVINTLLKRSCAVAYRSGNFDAFMQILYALGVQRDSRTSVRLSAMLEWLASVASQAVTTSVFPIDSQCAGLISSIRCISAIVWEHHNASGAVNVLWSEELVRTLCRLASVLPASNISLRSALGAMLCTLCHDKPDFFASVYETVCFKDRLTFKDGRCSSHKTFEMSERTTIHSAHNSVQPLCVSLLLDNDAVRLRTLAAVCLSEHCCRGLLASALPRTITLSLKDFCTRSIGSLRKSLRTAPTSADCETSNDKEYQACCLVDLVAAPAIIEFLRKCCSASPAMKDWFGCAAVDGGRVLWLPLLRLLSVTSSAGPNLSVLSESGRICDVIRCLCDLESHVIKLFKTVLCCHSPNQDGFAKILCAALQEHSQLRGYGHMPPFIKNLISKVLLEDEVLLVTVTFDDIHLSAKRTVLLSGVANAGDFHPAYSCRNNAQEVFANARCTVGDVVKHALGNATCAVPAPKKKNVNPVFGERQSSVTSSNVVKASSAVETTADFGSLLRSLPKATSSGIVGDRHTAGSVVGGKIKKSLSSPNITKVGMAGIYHGKEITIQEPNSGVLLAEDVCLSQLYRLLLSRGQLPPGSSTMCRVDLRVRFGHDLSEPSHRLTASEVLSGLAGSQRSLESSAPLQEPCHAVPKDSSELSQYSDVMWTPLGAFSANGGLALLSKVLPLSYGKEDTIKFEEQPGATDEVNASSSDEDMMLDFSDVDAGIELMLPKHVPSSNESEQSLATDMATLLGSTELKSKKVAKKPPTLTTIANVPHHCLLAFGLFLQLPGYPSFLLRRRAEAHLLLRLAIGHADEDDFEFAPMGSDGQKPLPVQPKAEASVQKTDRQLMATLPFELLGSLLDSVLLDSKEGVSLRQQVMDLGILDIIFACVAALSHHPRRLQECREKLSRGPVVAATIQAVLKHAVGTKSDKNGPEQNLLSNDSSSSSVGTDQSSSRRSGYWAKGTGFASGSMVSNWDAEKTLLEKRQTEQHIASLVRVIAAYINPGDRIPATLGGSFGNTDGVANLFSTPLPHGLSRLLRSSCLIDVLAAYLRNDSILEMAQAVPVYSAVLRLLRSFAIVLALASQSDPLREDIVCLLTTREGSSSSIIPLLRKLLACIELYESRLRNKKDGTSAVEDSGGLAQLIPDVQRTVRIVSQALELQDEQGSRGGNCAGAEATGIFSANSPPERVEKHSESLDETYKAAMKDLQFDTYQFTKEEGDAASFVVPYHYESMIRQSKAAEGSGNLARTRRLAQEATTLSTSLPLSAGSSVFVRCDEERLDVMKVLITGPPDTPYANGCFEFDAYFPADFPHSPPMINLQTTGNHQVRFNPNLYHDGKVCLSILNTWHGRTEEKWNAQASSFLQVLVSIQSLILVPEPYFNEPGYERSRGTPVGRMHSREYDANIQQATVKYAMLEQLRQPSECFKEVILRHFWLKKKEICEQIERWLRELESRASDDQANPSMKQTSRTTAIYASQLKVHYQQLQQELARMQAPAGLDAPTGVSAGAADVSRETSLATGDAKADSSSTRPDDSTSPSSSSV